MLDPETRRLIDTAKARRQVELSARFLDPDPSSGPDPRRAARREAAWADLEARIVEAAAALEGEGLRVLRRLKTRPEMVLTGPVSAWRRFLDGNRDLVGDQAVEFKHYVRPWSHGLPGFPE